MQIQRSGACGNSPKNLLLEDLAVALLSGDLTTVKTLTLDTVRWRVSASELVEGQAEVARYAQQQKPPASARLVIHHVISHGRAGAVTATLQRPRQSADDCCLFFTFANAKGSAVDSVVTYRAPRE